MISIVVPFLNERESIGELYSRIISVMNNLGLPFEIIFVDDGSHDGTFDEIKKLKQIRAFRFRRNFGQTAAFGCGIENAKGDIVVTMDGDLENLPEDIPALLQKIDEGYDVVAGWRQRRWPGQFMTRKLPSILANALISRMTGVRLHDHGCNLRAYRREVFRGVVFRGEMHRMLAAYLGMHGAKVTEIRISSARRKYGTSKYGLSRTFKVLLDVLAFYFFREYATRPMHFFGYIGFLCIGFGAITFLFSLYLRVFAALHFNRTPLPVLVAIFVVIGFQFILMGLLAEILTRRTNGSEKFYEVRERIEHN